MKEPPNKIERQWLASLTGLRVGVTPLAEPDDSIVFSLPDDSFSAAFKLLKIGGFFPLENEEKLTTINNHWQRLTANLSESLCLGVSLGFLTHPQESYRLPLFTAQLEINPDTPPGFLKLSRYSKLELSTPLVRLLHQKFGIGAGWFKQGQIANSLNIELIWQTLGDALKQAGAGRIKMERNLRVGLTHIGWNKVRKDLEKNIAAYRCRPLVQQYSQAKQPVSWQPEKTLLNPLFEDLCAPWQADSYQLQVPELFSMGSSFIVSGPPATGKMTAVANSLAASVAAGKSTLVLGTERSLKKLEKILRQRDLDHLLLSVQNTDENQNAKHKLSEAWDKPVNADENYLYSCRQSLSSLCKDLDLHCSKVHETGPHQVSAWTAFAAQLIAAAPLNDQEKTLAKELINDPNFPHQSNFRAAALKYATKLSKLDSHCTTGLSTNPWSLAGTKPNNINRTQLFTAVKSLELAISKAHPGVLEIMSACTTLSTWPVFAKWLDLLENGYGRAPVQLPEKERKLIVKTIKNLETDLEQLLDEATPITEIALQAYLQGKDLDLLTDARHAESSGKLTRNSRRKAVLSRLEPFLSHPIPPSKVSELLEELSALRSKAETLAARIESNPILGLPEFDPLHPEAQKTFYAHTNTVLTAIDLAHDLPNRLEDLELLMPLAKEGGKLGEQVNTIAKFFAEVLDSLQTTQGQLRHWSDGLPPLGKYLQVRKLWLQSLDSSDSSFDDMIKLRELSPKLKKLGLEKLLDWVMKGKLKGVAIQNVVEYALSVSSTAERLKFLENQSFTSTAHQSQAERLAVTVTETRREIQNVVKTRAAIFTKKANKNSLKSLGAGLRSQDFSLTESMRSNFDAVLSRTPIVGLTLNQICDYLSENSQNEFDRLIVLDAQDIPEGAVIKSLAHAKQVLWIATTPTEKKFGATRSALQAARESGFPQLELQTRYGENLSAAPQRISSQLHDTQLLTWPVAHEIPKICQTINMPVPPKESAPAIRNESPGWVGCETSSSWYEQAGKFLINLAAQNKSTCIQAVTWTVEMAQGIRSYLKQIRIQNPAIDLDVIQLSDLASLHGEASEVVVFFTGYDSSAQQTKFYEQDTFAATFSKLLLSVNKFFVLVDSHREADYEQLPPMLRKALRLTDLPSQDNDYPNDEQIIINYLAKMLSRAGLEVRTQLGLPPLNIDIAVRGDKDAPWLGLTLDTPQWCAINSAIDREIQIPQFLASQCGFGTIEHVFVSDLISDTDEVVRRIVSIALDLAFPADVTNGSIAQDDRYTSPARIAAAQNKRQAQTLIIPAIKQSAADLSKSEHEHKQDPKSQVTSTTNKSEFKQHPCSCDKPIKPNTDESLATDKELHSDPNSEFLTNLSLTQQLKTKSIAPVITEFSDSSLTHLNRSEIVESNAPSLAEQLADNKAQWVSDLAAAKPEDTGKITQPGFGAFAPLFPLKKNDSEPIDSKKTETGSTSLTVYRLEPTGSTIHDLGSKEMLDDLNNPDNAHAVTQALQNILATEGPVGTERLAKLVADAFGMQRLHPKRREALLDLLPAQTVIQTTKFGNFAWPEGVVAEEYQSFRSDSIYGSRPITAISDAEFNNALTWVIATQHPAEDEISDLVASALGLSSARTQMRQRIKSGLSSLEQSGKLASKNGKYYIK